MVMVIVMVKVIETNGAIMVIELKMFPVIACAGSDNSWTRRARIA
jgi:hypothetical protein